MRNRRTFGVTYFKMYREKGNSHIHIKYNRSTILFNQIEKGGGFQ